MATAHIAHDCHIGDNAIIVHLADPIIIRVSNIKVASGVKRDSVSDVERGVGGAVEDCVIRRPYARIDDEAAVAEVP